MSGADKPLLSSQYDLVEDVDLWPVTAAIMAFDVDWGGSLAFRHTTGQTSSLSAADNLNGRMRLVDERTGEISTYQSIEAFVLDGWSVANSAASNAGVSRKCR
jgi:hypothetical protein